MSQCLYKKVHVDNCYTEEKHITLFIILLVIEQCYHKSGDLTIPVLFRFSFVRFATKMLDSVNQCVIVFWILFFYAHLVKKDCAFPVFSPKSARSRQKLANVQRYPPIKIECTLRGQDKANSELKGRA